MFYKRFPDISHLIFLILFFLSPLFEKLFNKPFSVYVRDNNLYLYNIKNSRGNNKGFFALGGNCNLNERDS